jgi:pimeloyl-ACP methyl ester carboxylesterase
MGRRTELALGVLNGALGDYLHRTDNGLATQMQFVGGVPRDSRFVVLVHGLMCTEDVWTLADGTDYGTLLQRDLGYAPLYVRYNTGRRIAESGEELAKLLSQLARERDLEDLVLLGFSMGGLVIRSACHTAGVTGMPWLTRTKRAIYVGTPHLGSPWERAGRILTRVLRNIPNPYVELAADLGDLRSAGIKDLGDPCHPFPLLPSIRHHLVAGFIDERLATFFGDALVPLQSGTDGACVDARAIPPKHVKLVPGADHLSLARRPEVYEHIRSWCEEAA